MNIALFLTPKAEVVTLDRNHTVDQAMEIMARHRYTSVPVLDRYGRYDSTISEGDILWFINDNKTRFVEGHMDKTSIRKIQRHHKIRPVAINADMDSLIDLVAIQSFVPVVDDEGIFIGIIKRSEIINYALSLINKKVAAMV